jgi:[calcium/calmodulin-dependent protein kinase] kinase
VKLYEVIDDNRKDKLYLVMDFVKKGAIMSKRYWRKENKENERPSMTILDESLIGDTTMIKKEEKSKFLPEAKCLKYFREFMLGLDYLHNFCHIIHRDIKPENLLVDDQDMLKIADFGMAHIFEGSTDEVNTQHGTKCFMAPELWEGSLI